jgi:hypothetical protein
MNRRLLLLNAVLAAGVVWAGVQLRREYLDSKAREAAMLNKPVRQLPAPRYTPRPVEQPVLPSGYLDVARNLLFDKSRNPDVPIEPPPPPPPKPPMPALPVFHGIMNIGADGPTAIMSVNATAPHQAIHAGETIGQFKLVELSSEMLALEWNGEIVRKRPEELSNRTLIAVQQEAAPQRTEAPAAAAAAPAQPQQSGPGEVTNFGFKTCSMNDGHAEGEVVDGFRKVVHTTGPFGKSCTYDPVGK